MNFFLGMVCMAMPLYAGVQFPFHYGKAVTQAQKGDWEGAEKRLQSLLIDNPDNKELLYDLGVVAYNTKKYDTATSYFHHAAESNPDAQLKERALFNMANVHVAQKKLHDALDRYEEVLTLNPANKQAAHNRDVVKKMLEEEQKQQQEKNDTSKQNNNDGHDDADQKSSNDKSQNNNEKKDQNKKNNDSSGSDSSDDQPGDQSENNEGNNGDSQQSSDQPSDTDQGNTNQDSNQNQGSRPDKSLKNDANTSNDQKNQSGQQQGRDSKSEQSHEKGSNSRDTQQGESKNQSMRSGVQKDTQGDESQGSMSEHDKALAELMQWQEAQDGQAQKAILQRAVNRNGGKSHAKNRW